MRNAYNILIVKPEMMRPLGITMHRFKHNIRLNLRETGWEGVHWRQLVQDRDQQWALVNTVMKLQVP
jgi:hypothetical protein